MAGVQRRSRRCAPALPADVHRDRRAVRPEHPREPRTTWLRPHVCRHRRTKVCPAPPVAAVPAPGLAGLEITGNWVRLRSGLSIDLGGIGKGLAADIVADELIACGRELGLRVTRRRHPLRGRTGRRRGLAGSIAAPGYRRNGRPPLTVLRCCGDEHHPDSKVDTRGGCAPPHHRPSIRSADRHRSRSGRSRRPHRCACARRWPNRRSSPAAARAPHFFERPG